MTEEEIKKEAEKITESVLVDEGAKPILLVPTATILKLEDAILALCLRVQDEQREEDAKLMCFYCEHPEQYGPTGRIHGSKRLWHKELNMVDADSHVGCQSAAIRGKGE